MALFGVVNVDIVNSRNIGNRQELQERLKHLIKELNPKYAGVLVSPIAITLGDECQAVLANPSQSYNLVDAFQQCLWQYNIDIYAGIGIGEISTAINEDVRMMDGPCFHAAREAINAAKLFPKNKGSMATSKNNKVFFKEEEKVPLSSSLLAYAQESIRETAASLEVVIAALWGVGVFIRMFLSGVKGRSDIDKNIGTHMESLAYNRSTPDGGFIIGIMERFFIICSIALNMTQIIGFLLATKSIARFKKFDDDRFVETFIIGSFISFSCAIVAGVIIKALNIIPAM